MAKVKTNKRNETKDVYRIRLGVNPLPEGQCTCSAMCKHGKGCDEPSAWEVFSPDGEIHHLCDEHGREAMVDFMDALIGKEAQSDFSAPRKPEEHLH